MFIHPGNLYCLLFTTALDGVETKIIKLSPCPCAAHILGNEGAGRGDARHIPG